MTCHRQRPHHLDPRLDTARVAIVYKDFASRGFSHAGLGVTSICTAKVLRREGIWAEVWPCSDAADLRRRLELASARAEVRNEIPVTHLVIAAPWIATPTLAQLASDFPDVVWTVVCHSNVGFLSCDTDAIRLMREAAELQHVVHNVRAAANCEIAAHWASRTWGARLALLPNIYDLSEAAPPRRERWGGELLRIGMGGACRVLKNMVTGAAAAAELAIKLRVPVELFVSSGRDEGGSLRPVEEITRGVPNLTLHKLGWLSWPQFRAALRHLHVHLQPSHTESFNMTVADAIAAGVPSVVGPAIPWVPRSWIANVDDPHDIARVAESLLYDSDAAAEGRSALDGYARNAATQWKRFLLSRCSDAPSQVDVI